jgi:Mn2+/Fe2+ NRAMP family transporter
VTPWMIFFQQSASADKGLTPADLRHGRYDTIAGGALAALFGCGALIAGAALFGHGGASIQGLAGAGFPGALAHVSGGAVGTVFALGLIEAGAVAMLTISASTGYAVGECIGAPHSLNNSARRATVFYGANVSAALIAAVIILIPGMPLLSIALNANVLATVLLPVALVFLIMLANDRELMGRHVNGALTNVAAIAIVAFISICGAAYGIDSFLQTVHVI